MRGLKMFIFYITPTNNGHDGVSANDEVSPGNLSRIRKGCRPAPRAELTLSVLQRSKTTYSSPSFTFSQVFRISFNDRDPYQCAA